jgi:hypothetical protein
MTEPDLLRAATTHTHTQLRRRAGNARPEPNLLRAPTAYTRTAPTERCADTHRKHAHVHLRPTRVSTHDTQQKTSVKLCNTYIYIYI